MVCPRSPPPGHMPMQSAPNGFGKTGEFAKLLQPTLPVLFVRIKGPRSTSLYGEHLQFKLGIQVAESLDSRHIADRRIIRFGPTLDKFDPLKACISRKGQYFPNGILLSILACRMDVNPFNPMAAFQNLGPSVSPSNEVVTAKPQLAPSPCRNCRRRMDTTPTANTLHSKSLVVPFLAGGRPRCKFLREIRPSRYPGQRSG